MQWLHSNKDSTNCVTVNNEKDGNRFFIQPNYFLEGSDKCLWRNDAFLGGSAHVFI